MGKQYYTKKALSAYRRTLFEAVVGSNAVLSLDTFFDLLNPTDDYKRLFSHHLLLSEIYTVCVT